MHLHALASKLIQDCCTRACSAASAPMVSTIGSLALSLASTICTCTNNSTQHQRRSVYVSPLMTKRRSHAARKIGKHCRSALMFFWSIQTLSNHSVGGRLWVFSNSVHHLAKASHFSWASSCQLWLKN